MNQWRNSTEQEALNISQTNHQLSEAKLLASQDDKSKEYAQQTNLL